MNTQDQKINREAHIPVLLDQVLSFLTFAENTIYVDCTLGLGGHMSTMIQNIPSIDTAVGIDMDIDNLDFAKKRVEETITRNINFHWVHDRNDNIEEILTSRNLQGKVTSILFDLGLCSTQLDIATKGFSYKHDGPLDMRYNTDAELTAQEIIHSYSQFELTTLFRKYGEEPEAKKIAYAIIQTRKEQTIQTTTQLRDIIYKVSHNPRKDKVTSRVFQALRIEVNQELAQAERAIASAIHMLAPGGRIVVLTYHSLEDRITKNIFREAAKHCVCPKELYQCACRGKPLVQLLTKKPLTPTASEIEANPRSRSAKLRAIERI